MAVEYASEEAEKDALDEEAKKGGTAKDIAKRAKNKARTKFTLNLAKDIAEKLKTVSEAKGDNEKSRAIGYINKGVDTDYHELDGN